MTNVWQQNVLRNVHLHGSAVGLHTVEERKVFRGVLTRYEVRAEAHVQHPPQRTRKDRYRRLVYVRMTLCGNQEQTYYQYRDNDVCHSYTVLLRWRHKAKNLFATLLTAKLIIFFDYNKKRKKKMRREKKNVHNACSIPCCGGRVGVSCVVGDRFCPE